MLCFGILEGRRGLTLLLFPALFAIALLFPPLLLLIPAAALPVLLFIREVLYPDSVRVRVQAVPFRCLRSPPSAA